MKRKSLEASFIQYYIYAVNRQRITKTTIEPTGLKYIRNNPIKSNSRLFQRDVSRTRPDIDPASIFTIYGEDIPVF